MQRELAILHHFQLAFPILFSRQLDYDPMCPSRQWNRRGCLPDKLPINVNLSSRGLRQNRNRSRARRGNRRRCFILVSSWIETLKKLLQIRRTERKPDPLERNVIRIQGPVGSQWFLCIDADNLTVRVEQWPSAVARIDRGVCLHPSALALVVPLADRAHNSFGNRVLHALRGVANCNHSLSCANINQVCQRQVG